MSRYKIRLARPEDTQKVNAFNQRMLEAGETHHRISLDLPFRTMKHDKNSPITVERFFCIDGGEIRGEIGIKRMMFWVNDGFKEVAVWSKPLSEGIINPSFRGTGKMIVNEMLRRYPLIYATGAPGAGSARLMDRAGWFSLPIPFHFYVLKSYPFFRNINILRIRKWNKILLDLCAFSGMGVMIIRILRLIQRLSMCYPNVKNLEIERFDRWRNWADDVWDIAHNEYSLIGDRSSAALQSLYPEGHKHLIKLRFKSTCTNLIVGWAVITFTKLKNHKYFGNMKLTAIVDMLALPDNEYSVASGAIVAARQANADLLIVNHSAYCWNSAFKRTGMLPWKTNHYLWLSPKLEHRFRPIDDYTDRFYFTRGDGHGPTSLWMADYYSGN
jgi:hypothetical protein